MSALACTHACKGVRRGSCVYLRCFIILESILFTSLAFRADYIALLVTNKEQSAAG